MKDSNYLRKNLSQSKGIAPAIAVVFGFLFVLSSCNFLYGQVTEKWVARYNGIGSMNEDHGNSITVDVEGNVYVAGYSSYYAVTPQSNYVILKYNSQGIQQWIKTYNGPTDSIDQAQDIAVDPSGNVYVTGFSYGTETRSDYATIKYSRNGNEIWVARYNGTGNSHDRANSIAVDANGNVYVTGSSIGSGTQYDYLTIKYNSSGEELWVKRYNALDSLNDEAVSLAVDNTGNVYVAGSSIENGTSYDYATIKYNPSGVQQWIARYEYADHLTSMTIDYSGNVYVTGYRINFGYEDYLTIKYNSSGIEQWVTVYNGSNTDKAKDIDIDALGNVYVAGTSSYGYATIKYSPSGVEQWVASYDSGNAFVAAMAIDGSGNVYVTGTSNFDYLTVKYNTSGIEQWIKRYEGPTGSGSYSASIAVFEPLGNVYVTGQSDNYLIHDDIATIKYSQSSSLTGTLNIPGDYPDLSTAILDLNKQGVGEGGVTLNLVSGNPQTAPAGGYIVGGAGSSVLTTASSTKQIVIQGNGNTITAFSPQESGLLNDAVFKLIGADYVTISGFTIKEDTANSNTTPASNNMTEWGIALLHVSTTDGCQNNTIQNNNISLKRIYPNTFGIYSNNRHSASSVSVANDVTNSTTGPNSFNKVYSNNISNVNYGTVFIGSLANNAMDIGNDIGGSSNSTGNTYTNWGGIGQSPSGYLSLTTNNYCIFMNNVYNDNVSFNTIISAEGNVNSPLTIGGILKDNDGAQPSVPVFNTYNHNTISIKNYSTTGSHTRMTGIETKGQFSSQSSSLIIINNNFVTDCELYGPSAGTFLGITNDSKMGKLSISNNTIGKLKVNCTSAYITGISNTADVIDSINLSNNKIGDATTGFVKLDSVNYDEIKCIINVGENQVSTAKLIISGNDIRGIEHLTKPFISQDYFIYNNGFSGYTNISSNTFTDLSINSPGQIILINDVTFYRTPGISHVLSNNSIVEGFTKSTGGSVNFLNIGGSSHPNSADSIRSNNFSNVNLIGNSALTGVKMYDQGSQKTFVNNIFRNIMSDTGRIQIIDISNGDGGFGKSKIFDNNISNIRSNQGDVFGLRCSSLNHDIFQNKMDTLIGDGVQSIEISDGNTVNLFGNKINYISGRTVYGVLIEYSDSCNLYNNMVGNIFPVRNLGGNAHGRGILINNGSSINLNFNTIYMSYISDSLITSTGIYAVSSNTLTMKNNLIKVQNTGTGKVIAYRNSSINGYDATSNNNLFYAGTPSPNNLIFSDGASNNIQTLTAYKTFVSPRDSSSVTEDPNFISLNSNDPKYLHIDSTIASQIESGGITVAGIINDFDLQPRYPNSGYPNNLIFPADNPDIGADEFGGVPVDLAGPGISYSALSDSCGYNNRNLNSVAITDLSGVAAGSYKPRVYWKVNTSGTWSSSQTPSASSPYSFSINTSGMVSGDSVYYFVIAQDNFGNISANPSAGLSASDVNTISSYPANPNAYVLNCWLTGVSFEWVRDYYPNTIDNKPKCVEADNAGNAIVTGRIISSGADIVTLKYDPTGSLLWTRIFASPYYNGDDAVNDLKVDNSGNIYITGFESNSVSNEKNVVTIKYNPNGDSLWVKKYNGPANGNDAGNALTLDDSGNVYVTGYSTGTGTNQNVIVLKYNSSGNLVWSNSYNYFTNYNDIGNAIDLDDSGNVCIAAQSDYTGTGAYFYNTIKFNSSGNFEWARTYYSTGFYGIAKDIEADKTGNIYITGLSRGVNEDYATIKYSPGGDSLWVMRYNSPGLDEASALKLIYSDGNNSPPDVIVTGTSYHDFFTIKYDGETGAAGWSQRYDGPSNSIEKTTALDIDISGNVFVTGYSFDYTTDDDYMTIKYSGQTGEQLWSHRYNRSTTSRDRAIDIALANDGSIFVTGEYNPYFNIITTVKYKQPLPPPPPVIPAVLDLTILIQGLYNSATNNTTRDSLRCYIRNSTVPFAILDSSIRYFETDGSADYTLHSPLVLNNTPYYIQLKHRNAIETWSSNPVTFINSQSTYDFTNAVSKAYGSNQIQVDDAPIKYGMYSGEVVKNGVIDLDDMLAVYNDAGTFAMGYTSTDVNGDGITDLNDIVLTFNNSLIFVTVIHP